LSSSATETLTDILMPAMGTSITEGTVVAWSKAVGDHVVADETICEISTDKIDSECPSPAAGRLREICVEVGETVGVGTVIARLAGRGDALAGVPQVGSGSAPAAASVSAANVPRLAMSAAADGHANGDGPRRRYSPIVTRMAAVHAIDLERIAGTGAKGRVTKKDVLAHLERASEGTADDERPLHSESPYRPDPAPPASAPAAAPPAAAALPDDLGGVAAPLSRIRQSIGTAMRRSQDVAATCHTMVECDMTRVQERRRELGVTALPLVAREVIDTLRDYRDLNATLDGATITRFERVHLGIAVSLGSEGLIVPVIHDAQDLSQEGIGRRIKDLAMRARAKQLSPDEVAGATFTITNPGSSGALIATPVISLPQVAILDLEAIVRRPVVVIADGQESIAIRSVGNLILGWDHRALDGVYAAQFLTALRARLETI
jgi:pyruvate/2-oxoglutarate dehydrogenase complex dihydrolipoamide acyltransferase (E2) component